MYIIKNAFRCIGRAKGRNILIGIIALVIAVSACIGLSIRQASENAKASALAELSVTANISYDRGAMMGQIGGIGQGGFDRDQFADMMNDASELTLDAYELYATADSVEDFYYTISAYFNGSEDLSPVSEESQEDTESLTDQSSGFFQGMGGMMGGMMGGSIPSDMPGDMPGGSTPLKV